MTNLTEKLAKKSARRTSGKQVRLRLVYVDFWSVVKLAFLVTVCLAVVTIVGAFLIYMVVAQTGLFDSLNSLLSQIAGDGDSKKVKIDSIVSLGNVMTFALIVSLLNVIAGTALAAICAVLYNLSVKVTGGLVFGFNNN